MSSDIAAASAAGETSDSSERLGTPITPAGPAPSVAAGDETSDTGGMHAPVPLQEPAYEQEADAVPPTAGNGAPGYLEDNSETGAAETSPAVAADATDSQITPVSAADDAAQPSVQRSGYEYDYAGSRIEQHVGNVQGGTVVGVLIQQAMRQQRGDLLPADVIERVRGIYVPGGDYDSAEGLLKEHHLVVLHGAPGSGRYTTALRLLQQRVDAIRQVRRDPDASFGIEELTEEDTGWILDVRSRDEKLPPDFGLRLANDMAHLRGTRSYLVVAIDEVIWNRVGQHAAGLASALAPPPAEDVLRAHLKSASPPVDPESWLAEPGITQGIKGRLPGQVAAWAAAICSAEDLDRSRPRPVTEEDRAARRAESVASVIAAADDWRTHLMEWHTANEDSTYRNYLLAAAVLDGSPSETIYEAARTLAKALGEAEPNRRGQQGLGVVALTGKAGAELGADDTVWFNRPGYAEAVVEYFWADRPHLVGEFTRWSADQASHLPKELANPLVDRVSEWVLHYTGRKRTAKLLKSTVMAWAQPSANPAAAVDLLIAAALDPDTGQRARDAYRAWIRSDTERRANGKPAQMSSHAKSALAAACGRLAEIYSTAMVARLAELASGSTTDDLVTRTVGEALAALWGQPDQRDTIRTTVADWSASPRGDQRKAAHLTFAHLAARRDPQGHPELLAAEASDDARAWITAGWRGVLTHQKPESVVSEAFGLWMDAATDQPGLRDRVLATLSDAVYPPAIDTTHGALLHVNILRLLYAWAPEPSAQNKTQVRDALVTALLQRDPTAPVDDEDPTH